MERQRSVARFAAVIVGTALLQVGMAQAQSGADGPAGPGERAPSASSSELDWLSDDAEAAGPDRSGPPQPAVERATQPEAAPAENSELDAEADDERHERAVDREETDEPAAVAVDDAAAPDPEPDTALSGDDAPASRDNARAEADGEPENEAVSEPGRSPSPPAEIAEDDPDDGASAPDDAVAAGGDPDPVAPDAADAGTDDAPRTADTDAVSDDADPSESAATDADTGTVPASSGTSAEDVDVTDAEGGTGADADATAAASVEAGEAPDAAAPEKAASDAGSAADAATDEAPAQAAGTEETPGETESGLADSAEAEPSAERDEPEIAEKPAIDPKDVTLTIGTWAGAYGQAQERALFEPFIEDKGYQLETVIYDGDYSALEKQADEPQWSLVDLNGDALVRACDEGRLERLDPAILQSAPDGTAASEDFLAGAIHPCGVASVAWSAVVVFNDRLAAKPGSLTDLFDTVRIPGKRLLPKRPRYTLELALMADGVAPERIYEVLKTPQGQDRAFAKLSSIKDDIVWWDDPAEVFGRISGEDAVMGLGFNGRAFMSIMGAKQPLGVLWDGQIYSYDYWAIPRGAPFADQAKEFIGFATGAERLADQAEWIPYGPARRSAVGKVGRHPELDIDMKPHLPTYGPNFANALAFDGAFWDDHEAALQDRFAEWVSRRQLPVRKQVIISQ